jgi:Pyruvate/2-oxoacid:ferredoxin oxidoreductase delta subunit/flavodoxin
MRANQLKIGLFYYTGTGSTAFFGEHIKRILEEHDCIIESKRVTHDSSDNWDDYDVIGLGVPVWIWRAPHVFTKRLKNITKKPYFIFMTCGGSSGNTAWSIYKAMKGRNNTYLGYIQGNGANNIRAWRPKLTKPDATHQNNVKEEDLERAHDFILGLEQKLRSTSAEDISTLETKKPKMYFYWSILAMMSKWRWCLRIFIGKKTVNEEKCTRCGLCSTKICPSGAITLTEDNFPIINEKNCQGCWGCVNLCPTLAIETKTAKKKHPLTTYSKYIMKN